MSNRIKEVAMSSLLTGAAGNLTWSPFVEDRSHGRAKRSKLMDCGHHRVVIVPTDASNRTMKTRIDSLATSSGGEKEGCWRTITLNTTGLRIIGAQRQTRFNLINFDRVLVSGKGKHQHLLRLDTEQYVIIMALDTMDELKAWARSITWRIKVFKIEEDISNQKHVAFLFKQFEELVVLSKTLLLKKMCTDAEMLKTMKLILTTGEQVLLGVFTQQLVQICLDLTGPEIPVDEIACLYTKSLQEQRPHSTYLMQLFEKVTNVLHRSTSLRHHPELMSFVVEAVHNLHITTDKYRFNAHLSRLFTPRLTCPSHVFVRNVVITMTYAVNRWHSNNFQTFESNKSNLSKLSSSSSLNGDRRENFIRCNSMALLVYNLSLIKKWRLELATCFNPDSFLPGALDSRKVRTILRPIVLSLSDDREGNIIEKLVNFRHAGWLNVYKPKRDEANPDDDVFLKIVMGMAHVANKNSKWEKYLREVCTYHLDVFLDPNYTSNISIIKTLCDILDTGACDKKDRYKVVSGLFWSDEGVRELMECRRRWLVRLSGHRLNNFKWNGPILHKLHKNFADRDLVRYYERYSWENLRYLDCSNSKLTSIVSTTIAKIPKLKKLSVQNTMFGDNGLRILAHSAVPLKLLDLRSTICSMEAIKYFKRMKPKCFVVFDPVDPSE